MRKREDTRPSLAPVVPISGTVVTLAILLLPVLLAYLAFELTPSGGGIATSSNDPKLTHVRLFAGLVEGDMSAELQMLLFVMLLAGLGGFVGAVQGRGAAGQRSRVTLLTWYGLQTAIGSSLGAAFYILIRAGVFTSEATSRDVNPLGMAVLAIGVGLFAPAAMKRFRDIFMGLYAEEPEIARAIERLDERFQEMLADPTLDNYDGTVSVRLCDSEGEDLPAGEGAPVTRPGQHCRVEVAVRARRGRGR